MRAYCSEHNIFFQSFWTLTANRKAGGAIRSDVVRGLAAQHGVTPEVIFFRFVMGQGMIPLTVRAQLSSYLAYRS